ARAHRVHARVGGEHGDLRPGAGFAGNGLHLDDALGDLRHLALEQPAEEVGVRARQDDLRALGAAVHVQHHGAHVVVLAVVAARDLLAGRQQTLGEVELHDDVAAVHLLHDAANERADLVGVLLEHLVALGFADTLDEHLLRGLDSVAAELGDAEGDADYVADLRVRLVGARALHGPLERGVLNGLDDAVPQRALEAAG